MTLYMQFLLLVTFITFSDQQSYIDNVPCAYLNLDTSVKLFETKGFWANGVNYMVINLNPTLWEKIINYQ